MTRGITRLDPAQIDFTSDRLGAEYFSEPFLCSVQGTSTRAPLSEGGSSGLNAPMSQSHVSDIDYLSSCRDPLQHLHGRYIPPHPRTSAVASSPTEEDMHEYHSRINNFLSPGAAIRAPSSTDDCYAGLPLLFSVLGCRERKRTGKSCQDPLLKDSEELFVYFSCGEYRPFLAVCQLGLTSTTLGEIETPTIILKAMWRNCWKITTSGTRARGRHTKVSCH